MSHLKSLLSEFRKERIEYDPGLSEPVLHKSICTGETTAGLLDRASGKYHEIRPVQDEKDIAGFCRQAGVDRDKIRTIY